MKTIFTKSALVFFTILTSLLFLSCSENEDFTSNQNNSLLRALLPPEPNGLRGLFDVTFNNGTESNFLFEYENHVTNGTPTITEKLNQSWRRVNYSLVADDTYTFSNNDGINTYNYRFTYAFDYGKITGTYGVGASYVNLGTFSGKRHEIANSGIDLFKGYWLGYYGSGAEAPNNDYLMVFEENGKFTVAAHATLYGSSPASGTYSFFGNTVMGSYSYLGSSSVYSFVATCNAVNKRITGTWGYGSSNSNGGSFYLDSWNF